MRPIVLSTPGKPRRLQSLGTILSLGMAAFLIFASPTSTHAVQRMVLGEELTNNT